MSWGSKLRVQAFAAWLGQRIGSGARIFQGFSNDSNDHKSKNNKHRNNNENSKTKKNRKSGEKKRTATRLRSYPDQDHVRRDAACLP